jgi:hypothetical protein
MTKEIPTVRVTWTLRILSAAALLAVAADHLYEYDVDHYSAIPTIGTLFLLNGLSATALAVVLLVPVQRIVPQRLATAAIPAAAVSGIVISVTSLAALFISESTPLFGFMEYGYRFVIVLAIVAEAAATVLLVALLLRMLSRSGRPSEPSRLRSSVRAADTSNATPANSSPSTTSSA